MYVFVDDSGDCGLHFDKGASTHLVMAAVVFREREHIQKAMAAVAEARYSVSPEGQEFVYKREFKYNASKKTLKDRFFECIKDVPFDLRVVILDKRTLRSSHLAENQNNMKSYLIRQMLSNTLGTVHNAKLIIDGDDTRAFGSSDRSYFMKMVNRKAPGTIREVEFVDSRRSAAIQIADMTAGAVRRGMGGDIDALMHEATFRSRYKYPTGSRWVMK